WFTEIYGNKVMRITPSGNQIGSFPVPTASSQPQEITTGPDGNMWFAEYGGNKIGQVALPSGTITEYATGLSPSSGPEGIAAGPDGALWFTEYSGNRIGRIT